MSTPLTSLAVGTAADEHRSGAVRLDENVMFSLTFSAAC